MIFIVLHWYFLFVSKPNPSYHVAVVAILSLYKKFVLKKPIKWRKQWKNTLGIILMYIGFYVTRQLAHYGFLPFWAISIVGLRKKMNAFLLFSVVTGVFLTFVNLIDVLAHVGMNIGRLLRTRPMSIDSCIISNAVLSIVGPLLWKGNYMFGYREVLGTISTIHLISRKENMDIFSICMCFSYFWALLLPLVHLSCLNWYQCYENNHFRRVKRSYLFFTPIAIMLLRLSYAV